MCWIVDAGTSFQIIWISSNDVPPKELHWPLCRGWRLGWCRMLPMPVSMQSCGCCPVVTDWYFILCHTQYNHSPGWSEQWPGTASEVSPPHFKERPLRWGSEPHCIVSQIIGASPNTALGTLLTPPLAGVFPIFTNGGRFAIFFGAAILKMRQKGECIHKFSFNITDSYHLGSTQSK